ncbi:MAG: septum formation initiator family protein [Candidatus Omnitrophota bacterium]
MKKFKFFIIIGILFLVFLPGYVRLQELKTRLVEVEEQIQKIQKENDALEKRIALMQNNQAYLEVVARDKMGVVKKGETVLKIVTEGEPQPPADSKR